MNPFKWTLSAMAATAFSAFAFAPAALADDDRKRYRDGSDRHYSKADRRYDRHYRKADRRYDHSHGKQKYYDRGHRGDKHYRDRSYGYKDRGYARKRDYHYDRGYRHGYNKRYYRNHRHGHYDWNDYWRRYDGHYRHYGYRRHKPRVYYHPQFYKHRYSYKPRWRVGGHYGYSHRSAVVHDYGRYGLYDPPHGHHWVRDHDRGDAILASVATGAIIGLAVGVLAYD